MRGWIASAHTYTQASAPMRKERGSYRLNTVASRLAHTTRKTEQHLIKALSDIVAARADGHISTIEVNAITLDVTRAFHTHTDTRSVVTALDVAGLGAAVLAAESQEARQ